MGSHFYTKYFTATDTEMAFDIGKDGPCIVYVQRSSASVISSLFLVSWNANTNQKIIEASDTKDTNPRRPLDGSTMLTLSNLVVNSGYTIRVIFFE